MKNVDKFVAQVMVECQQLLAAVHSGKVAWAPTQMQLAVILLDLQKA